MSFASGYLLSCFQGFSPTRGFSPASVAYLTSRQTSIHGLQACSNFMFSFSQRVLFSRLRESFNPGASEALLPQRLCFVPANTGGQQQRGCLRLSSVRPPDPENATWPTWQNGSSSHSLEAIRCLCIAFEKLLRDCRSRSFEPCEHPASPFPSQGKLFISIFRTSTCSMPSTARRWRKATSSVKSASRATVPGLLSWVVAVDSHGLGCELLHPGAEFYCEDCIMNLCESCTKQWPVSHRRDGEMAKSFMKLSGIAEPEHRRTTSWSSWWKAGARARSCQIRLSPLDRHTCLVMHSRPELLPCASQVRNMHRAQYCAIHRTSRYDLYCHSAAAMLLTARPGKKTAGEDCEMLICPECARTDHQQHRPGGRQSVPKVPKPSERDPENLGCFVGRFQSTASTMPSPFCMTICLRWQNLAGTSCRLLPCSSTSASAGGTAVPRFHLSDFLAAEGAPAAGERHHRDDVQPASGRPSDAQSLEPEPPDRKQALRFDVCRPPRSAAEASSRRSLLACRPRGTGLCFPSDYAGGSNEQSCSTRLFLLSTRWQSSCGGRCLAWFHMPTCEETISAALQQAQSNIERAFDELQVAAEVGCSI